LENLLLGNKFYIMSSTMQSVQNAVGKFGRDKIRSTSPPKARSISPPKNDGRLYVIGKKIAPSFLHYMDYGLKIVVEIAVDIESLRMSKQMK
jgi:hypothetical protein